jgi:acetolactate synthase I/II/III large subunit
MNGAESLARTLTAGEVDVCFANPGTSEMYFVAALDKTGGMRRSHAPVPGRPDGLLAGASLQAADAQPVEDGE